MKALIQAKDGLTVVDLNRRRAIREKCLNCSAWIPSEVRNCKFTNCALWPYRTGEGKQDPTKRAEAIRAKCMWCTSGQKKEVRLCPSTDCPLWIFRLRKVDRSIEIETASPKIGHIEGDTKHDFETEYSG